MLRGYQRPRDDNRLRQLIAAAPVGQSIAFEESGAAVNVVSDRGARVYRLTTHGQAYDEVQDTQSAADFLFRSLSHRC